MKDANGMCCFEGKVAVTSPYGLVVLEESKTLFEFEQQFFTRPTWSPKGNFLLCTVDNHISVLSNGTMHKISQSLGAEFYSVSPLENWLVFGVKGVITVLEMHT